MCNNNNNQEWMVVINFNVRVMRLYWLRRPVCQSPPFRMCVCVRECSGFVLLSLIRWFPVSHSAASIGAAAFIFCFKFPISMKNAILICIFALFCCLSDGTANGCKRIHSSWRARIRNGDSDSVGTTPNRIRQWSSSRICRGTTPFWNSWMCWAICGRIRRMNSNRSWPKRTTRVCPSREQVSNCFMWENWTRPRWVTSPNHFLSCSKWMRLWFAISLSLRCRYRSSNHKPRISSSSGRHNFNCPAFPKTTI